MNWLITLFFGVVQGLTEFLPVSSSGHLLFFDQLFKLGQPELLVISLHFATLLAVIIFFRRELKTLSWRQWLMIGVANIPVLTFGYISKDWLVEVFGTPRMVGFALLITALINYGIVRRMESGKLAFSEFGWRQALGVGFFQAFALLPGISRSGTTILAGLVLGFRQDAAFRFSFLLSLPAILAASAYEALQVFSKPVAFADGWRLFWAAVAAFVTGYLALWWLKRWLKPERWQYFVYYTALVGLLLLLAAGRLS